MKIETTTVNTKIAKKLQIDSSEEVITLKRVRWVNDEPIFLETSSLPKKLISKLSYEILKSILYLNYWRKNIILL